MHSFDQQGPGAEPEQPPFAPFRALAEVIAATQAASANARAQRGLGAVVREPEQQAVALSQVLAAAQGWREAADRLGGQFAPAKTSGGENQFRG